MLLRRITQHVRDQDWTAITLDLIIVVVGVYIGIQAQAWSNEREERQLEQQYLLRLHDELAGMLADSAADVALRRERMAFLDTAMQQLAGEPGALRLSVDHCVAIRSSHIYVDTTQVPPTIEELRSTGRLSLIGNPELRTEMVRFTQTVEQSRQLVVDIQSDRLTLSRVHPELIKLDLLNALAPVCDFEAMMRSPQFLNHLADNYNRFSAYVDEAIVGQHEQSAQLHSLLDEALRIDHADDAIQPFER